MVKARVGIGAKVGKGDSFRFPQFFTDTITLVVPLNYLKLPLLLLGADSFYTLYSDLMPAGF